VIELGQSHNKNSSGDNTNNDNSKMMVGGRELLRVMKECASGASHVYLVRYLKDMITRE
jgi:hypothetical protein